MVQPNVLNYKFIRKIVNGILESPYDLIYIVDNKDNKTYTLYSGFDRVSISKLGYTVPSKGDTVYYYDLLSKKEAKAVKIYVEIWITI